jgi:hypothetical protein
LLKWQERRQLIAGQKDSVHHLYRKAEGIEEHLMRVNVPPIRTMNDSDALPSEEPVDDTDLKGKGPT